MQPAPERLALRASSREERRMLARLAHCQRELAGAQADGARDLDAPALARAAIQARCEALQGSCDGLAIELAHLRLAMLGARDELATCDRPLATAG